MQLLMTTSATAQMEVMSLARAFGGANCQLALGVLGVGRYPAVTVFAAVDGGGL